MWPSNTPPLPPSPRPLAVPPPMAHPSVSIPSTGRTGRTHAIVFPKTGENQPPTTHHREEEEGEEDDDDDEDEMDAVLSLSSLGGTTVYCQAAQPARPTPTLPSSTLRRDERSGLAFGPFYPTVSRAGSSPSAVASAAAADPPWMKRVAPPLPPPPPPVVSGPPVAPDPPLP
ncbi:hypothetical protein BGZ61DRAFT_483034 [Ilyonectria robusta]|uniref:uncharacterized protein n=1 Tax=Ilyonectria robusta TaxID=1079257 RepID=UPI001E8DB064|nr:uncharacterized protein BGZ61DRAFT_483034 [Ilyonectria robusta]KAH8670689.1 hypothetical protein BGZ61DRAFT_483034 [Ilyonectria robusta]